MRLTRIDLDGFGCLRDFHAELAPGLNVFYGMNEAGKSTLQQAVRALLYGFYAADRARPDETARHERFRPWGGGLYRGSLEYETADGRRFEVRRDFSSADVQTQLIDLFTGEDVASSYGRGRHGNIPFARKQLGMSRKVFESCAFVSQGEIFHVAENGPKEIADAIAALADSAGRDISAARAIERLKNLLARIGSDRARTAELPKARGQLAAAEAELAAIDAARFEISESAAELDRLQDALRRVDAGIAKADLEFLEARVRELTGRLKSLDEAEEMRREAEETASALQSSAHFPIEQRDAVLALKDRRERANEALERSRRTLDDAEEAMPQEDRIEFEALREAAGWLDGERITALEGCAYARVRSWPLRLAAAIARAMARAANAVWRFIRRMPPPETAPAPSSLNVSREGALALLERHRRYLQLAPEMQRLRELRARHEAAEAEFETVDGRLGAILESAGVDAQAGIEAAVNAFLERCRERQGYEAATREAEEASKRIELLLNGSSREEFETELEECRQQVAEIKTREPELAGVRASASSRDLAVKRESLRQKRSQLELQVERLREEVRITMSRHRSRAEVEEESAYWRSRVSDLERARAAVEAAVDAIEEAMVSVYRDFAPAVSTYLSDGIERVTGGRYTRAHVDPKTLAVSLLVPETGQVVKDPPVSHGTRTLAYVLMRIGLAQHMSSVGEPVPLVLDDPFVDVDAERLPRIFDYLAEICEAIQVLVFTKDEEIVSWHRRSLSSERHRIHELSPAVAAAI